MNAMDIEIEHMKQNLKKKEKQERSLLEEVQQLKKEIERLKAEKTNKYSATRRLSTRQNTIQLNNMSREALFAMKEEIETLLRGEIVYLGTTKHLC